MKNETKEPKLETMLTELDPPYESKEELDIEDGLADPNVYVLDPCCGTGAYLVEVLKKSTKHLRIKALMP